MFHATHIFHESLPAFQTYQARQARSKIIYQHSKTLQIPKLLNFDIIKFINGRYIFYLEIVQFFNNLHEGQRIQQFET